MTTAKYIKYRREGGIKSYLEWKEKDKAVEERLRIIHIISVYQNLYHHTSKEWKIIGDIISKI